MAKLAFALGRFSGLLAFVRSAGGLDSSINRGARIPHV